jgi:hypothetical protein
MLPSHGRNFVGISDYGTAVSNRLLLRGDY